MAASLLSKNILNHTVKHSFNSSSHCKEDYTIWQQVCSVQTIFITLSSIVSTVTSAVKRFTLCGSKSAVLLIHVIVNLSG
jgi:hypothetical protein